MHYFPRYGSLPTALLAGALLVASLGQRLSNPASAPQSIDDWDIPELVDHLKRAGLEVRLRSTRIDGVIAHNAFLTNTDQDWGDLNRLQVGPLSGRIQEWHGTVYCERVRGQDPAELIRQWGDHGLVAGSFIFYGDAMLLERIHTALAPYAPSGAP